MAAITLILSTSIAIFLIRTQNFYFPSLGTIRTYGVRAYGGNITTQDGKQVLDWGTAAPGAQTNRSFYIESECNVPATLEFIFNNWMFRDSEGKIVNASLSHYITPNPDYNGTIINPRDSIYATITLQISANSSFISCLIDEKVTEFSFDIHIYAKE